MTRSAEMTPLQIWVATMVAVNVALPFAFSVGLRLLQSPNIRFGAFLVCVFAILGLNRAIAPLVPRLKPWVWTVSILNVLAAFFLGSVALITSVPAWPLLVRMLLGVNG